MSHLRTLAALVIACAMGLGSCYLGSGLLTAGMREAAGVEVAIRLTSPILIGALIAGWVYYLLLAGPREDLLSRRERRAARRRQVPSPMAMSTLAIVLVVGASALIAGPILSLGGLAVIVGVPLLAGGLLLGLLLAIVVGIVTARVRARQAPRTVPDGSVASRA